MRSPVRLLGVLALGVTLAVVAPGPPAHAQLSINIGEPAEGVGGEETGPADENPRAAVDLDFGGGDAKGKPSQSIVILLVLTLLAVAPALLIMLTSFTRIVVVLSLTRNALGLQAIPPNQVVVGLALFLSFFVMGPTLAEMNTKGLQPYLKGDLSQQEAYEAGVEPLRDFMFEQTREAELAMFVKESGGERPDRAEDVSMTALIPAFILSELKTAFIIGFIVFIPFLVVDLVISSSLMSMGMLMLPPILISLPFKLLLFVMVDGWGLVVRSLLTSFH